MFAVGFSDTVPLKVLPLISFAGKVNSVCTGPLATYMRQLAGVMFTQLKERVEALPGVTDEGLAWTAQKGDEGEGGVEVDVEPEAPVTVTVAEAWAVPFTFVAVSM